MSPVVRPRCQAPGCTREATLHGRVDRSGDQLPYLVLHWCDEHEKEVEDLAVRSTEAQLLARFRGEAK